jgi:hypothetical protein
MPCPLTKRKGQAKRKASENALRALKKATTPKSTPQRAPSIRTNASDKVIVISVDDASDDDKPPPKSTADVSHTIFTVSRYILLNKDPVLEDTDFLTLGQFNYREFDVLGIRKLVKYAEDHKLETNFISGQAVISAKGVPVREHIKIVVENENGWKKVEQGVEAWMHQKRVDIRVMLTHTYSSIKGRVYETLDEEEDDLKKVRTIKDGSKCY